MELIPGTTKRIQKNVQGLHQTKSTKLPAWVVEGVEKS